MPKKTHGPDVEARVKRLLEALLDFANGEFEDNKFDIKFKWEAENSANPKLIIKTTLVALEHLTAKDKYSGKLTLTKPQIREALSLLKDFLKILEDNRTQTRGIDTWHFTLRLWSKNQEKNLKQFEQAWESSRPEKSKALQANSQKSDESYWQEICRAMLEKHKRLTTNQLLFADEDMKFDREDIHVPLVLVERTKPKKCSEDILAEQGSRLYEPSYEEKQRFEHEAFLGQVIRDGVGKTQGHRIALIGEPGAGKTTQLQTIAFWILNNNLGLPIWISLADLQEGKSVKDYLLQDWLENALKVVDVTKEQKETLGKLFLNNCVWLLLDAADEMSSPQPLTKISDQLTGWVEDARVVLTCRVNVWEANANALENFETYRLLNFEYPQQVQEFIRGWFHKKDADKGERLSKELDKAERQRIQDLVKNPLRLALLCSTWQGSDKGLPETKAGLYQQFVEEFYKWKENRFPTTEQQQEELNAALGRLAKRAIDQETSRFRLRHKLVREELGDAKQPNSLFWLALKLGWLNEVGLAAESATKEKVYAFYHPTFEEYFAALAVENWHEFLNHVPDNPAEGVYRIFAPQWKEVILLWLGREDVGKKEKEEFIQALVEFDDGCGFYTFRAYFLAAAGVDEWKDSCNADTIVAEIVKWGFGEFKVELNKWVEFIKPITEGARTALPQTNRIKAIAALVELIRNPQQDDSTRWQAASSLEQIDRGNQEAIAALVELIRNPQLDDSTRSQAAYSLGQIGSGNQEAIAALVELIRNPQQDDFTRSQAAFSLGQIGSGNQEAIAALVELIRNPQQDDFTRRSAASSLGKIGSGNKEAIAALVELIRNPQQDDSTRSQAAFNLEKIDRGNQKAIDALVELIGKPQLDDSTRRLAAYSLEKIDPGNQKAIDALVELIGKPQLDYATRRQAAYSLGKIDPGNQKAIDALVKLIRNPQLDDSTRSQAAESLEQIDRGNQKAIDALVELIGKPQLDDSTRRRASESLEKIMLEEQMPSVVTVLKDYLSPESYKNDFKLFDDCYRFIWKCAQSMPYPAFYQAWHQQEKVKDGE